MMKELLKVSLRQRAIIVPDAADERHHIKDHTVVLIANLAKFGYSVSEPLLAALNNTAPAYHAAITDAVSEVLNTDKNWAPLVKGWDTATGESMVDHIITWFANIFRTSGTRLSCGHLIPANTFPLERYTGCPFCGTPFEMAGIEKYGQAAKLRLLTLWNIDDTTKYMCDLIGSKTALDATQVDSLRILLRNLPIPELVPAMKETAIIIIDALRTKKEEARAQYLFNTPNDVLRYLWFKHTGFLQIVQPRTITSRVRTNAKHVKYRTAEFESFAAQAKLEAKNKLRLKYNRHDCLVVAGWLNQLQLEPTAICEMMHPKRGMWVGFIRALRLAEYSKRKGFEKLRQTLDLFYNENYPVWQGDLEQSRLKYNAAETFRLLKQRPGLFARSLFANMLWFGLEETGVAFSEIIHKVPARLLLTLNMYKEIYFDTTAERIAKPLGGVSKKIPVNYLLKMYSKDELASMQKTIEEICLLAIRKRFENVPAKSASMYIAPALFNITISIGDRSETVQDLQHALQGERFLLEGTKLRLFMHWGSGLEAQHMDMDLSCLIAYDGRFETCSYFSLVTIGCRHSGDIRSIPDKVGTAEYIEIDTEALEKAGAQYVSFTCNAYSTGALSPNLVVGWMNSEYPMQISEKTGVAYDPSCVQHQVRVRESLNKGLLFGVLDVKTRAITWLEMSMHGQTVLQLDLQNVQALLKKLKSKITIGQLLTIKAGAQNLLIVDKASEDAEAYSLEWAKNTAAVTQLLVD